MRHSSNIGNSSEQVPVLDLQWEAGECSVFARRGSMTMVVIVCVPVAFSLFIRGLGDGCLVTPLGLTPMREQAKLRLRLS